MDEKCLINSLCYTCGNREYTDRYTVSGKFYRNWECLFPTHRHVFGNVHEPDKCPDYTEERL